MTRLSHTLAREVRGYNVSVLPPYCAGAPASVGAHRQGEVCAHPAWRCGTHGPEPVVAVRWSHPGAHWQLVRRYIFSCLQLNPARCPRRRRDDAMSARFRRLNNAFDHLPPALRS